MIVTQLSELKQKVPRKLRGCGLRLRPSVTGVKLDMLLGNANIKYDPDRHMTNKNPTYLDWGHYFSFDPINEGEAKLNLNN